MVLKSAVLFFLCASFGFSGFSSYAEILTHAKVDSRDLIGEALKKEISSKFSGAKVDLTSAIHWPQGLAISNPATVTLLDEDGRGAAHFIARGMLGESAEGFVHFAAWAPARVALRRIHPGERLTPDQFVLQDVNVATGQAHEYRGVILAQETPLIGLETRQSSSVRTL